MTTGNLNLEHLAHAALNRRAADTPMSRTEAAAFDDYIEGDLEGIVRGDNKKDG